VNVRTTPTLRLDSYQLAQETGVQGVAMRGPTMPVCQTDVPCDEPYPGAIITVQPAGGGKEIARATADDKGNFQIPLHPGMYLIVPLNADGNDGLPHAASQKVQVPESGFAQVTVNYDTGIR
jgi:hypothetical protein